jgi:hypothetical protein
MTAHRLRRREGWMIRARVPESAEQLRPAVLGVEPIFQPDAV